MRHQALLNTVGTRVRALRERRGISRRKLSEASGVSERFLAQLESGKGNISLARFADVAIALGTTPAELLVGATPQTGTSRIVALLGVRGAGKSTIGAALAGRRGDTFVELDARIEDIAGLNLSEVFELHGEGYYRRLEREALSRVLTELASAVIATGGSIVTHRDNFSVLKERCTTVWLRADAEDHWDRVIRQGDRRPMGENPHAFAELKALLAAREPLYATADHVVETSNRTIDDVVDAVLRAVGGAETATDSAA